MKNKIKFLKSIILTICLMFLLAGVSNADNNLKIENIKLSNDLDKVAIFSTPTIDITIKNESALSLVLSDLEKGFIYCRENNSQLYVFESQASSPNYLLLSGEEITFYNNKLNSDLALTERTIGITCNINGQTEVKKKEFSFTVEKIERFDLAMDKSIKGIKNHLDTAEANSIQGGGGDSIKNFVFNKIVNVVTPIMIVVGIAIGIIGAYKLFFSTNADDTKKGVMLIVYGMIGIIIIISSRYIGNVIFSDMFSSGDTRGLVGVELAQQIYRKIAYPFIKIAIYLVLGVLFVILAGKVFGFITKTDGSGKTQAVNTIARSTVAMLIIIGAKQIVEAVYGKQDSIFNQNAQDLGEIGTGILANKSIPIFYSIINRIMGLTSLVILIIIIFQTFKILTNPDKAENWNSIAKSILYIFIGILIIGTGYVLTNFLVIN